MKISIDNAIYPVKQGEADESARPREEASAQDVAIVLKALQIVQTKRPRIMDYLKVYKVRFAQLRARGGSNVGGKEAIPYIILHDPASLTEISLQMSTNGSVEGSCLYLPLSDPDAIATWIVKHLDISTHGKVMRAEGGLDFWRKIAEEADSSPHQ